MLHLLLQLLLLSSSIPIMFFFFLQSCAWSSTFLFTVLYEKLKRRNVMYLPLIESMIPQSVFDSLWTFKRPHCSSSHSSDPSQSCAIHRAPFVVSWKEHFSWLPAIVHVCRDVFNSSTWLLTSVWNHPQHVSWALPVISARPAAGRGRVGIRRGRDGNTHALCTAAQSAAGVRTLSGRSAAPSSAARWRPLLDDTRLYSASPQEAERWNVISNLTG